MKKTVCILTALLICVFCFASCKEQQSQVSDGNVQPTEYVSNVNGYIVQPSNAMQQVITGMPLCYLDYVVENAPYYDAMSKAVVPVIIQSPEEFNAFFDGEADENKLAAPVKETMFATEEGKAIYLDSEFYETWNLLLLSVRESNAETTHTIDSVTYNTDSAIISVNATRNVAEGEGEHIVYHYVFRVPANVYMGVNNSFLKAE